MKNPSLSVSQSRSPAFAALSHGSTIGVRQTRPISTGELVGADVQVCPLPAGVRCSRSRATSGHWRPRSRSDGSLTTSATAHKDPASVWSSRTRQTSGHSRRSSRSDGSLTTAATAPSSSHHKSAMSPRRRNHSLDGASAWRLHRPDFNHALPTEQRSQRSTENPWKGNSCVDMAGSIRRARTKSAPSVRADDEFSAKIPKNRPKGLRSRHLRRPKEFRKNQKNSAKFPNFSSQWVMSKELMTRPMLPQKSEKGRSTDISGGPKVKN
jgi:hypothetical protein